MIPVFIQVDWTRVSDADIQRCELTRLRAGIIERLVGEGHAVVSRVDKTGIHVELASEAQGLRLRVTGGGAVREQSMRANEPCDATFALDLISRVAELVEEVARSRKPQAAPAVDAEPQGARFAGSLDLTARINETPDAAFGGGLGARAHGASGWQLGGRLELTLAAGRGVTVLEGFAGFTGAYLPAAAGLGPCFEVGPLLHLGSSDARSVTELDAAAGAGGQVRLGTLFAQALLYGRLRSLAHRMGSDVVYDTGRFGVIVRLGWQPFGP